MSAWAVPAEGHALGSRSDSTHRREIKKKPVAQTRRVLIADDRSRSRRGLRALLTTYPGIEVVGEAGDGREALRMMEVCRPHVVVMDAKMPAMDGVTATRLIKEHWPEIKVIMLTMYGARRADALGSGADAFLVKGCPAEEILAAVLEHKESG